LVFSPLQGRLDAIQRHVPSSALADASTHRTPAHGCEACAQNPLGMCVVCAEDRDCITTWP